jgi:DNA polymerase kappa
MFYQLVFVKPDFSKYEAASAATREVFKLYDPHFEAGSLDEAYLDVTDYCAQHGMTGEQVGQFSGQSIWETVQVDMRRCMCVVYDEQMVQCCVGQLC